MGELKKWKLPLFLGMGGVCLLFIVGVALSFLIAPKSYKVDTTFYFLVLPVEDKTVSAWSQNVYVSGGAGYVFTHEKQDYVALASYPTQAVAEGVQGTLQEKGQEVLILPLTLNALYFVGRENVEAQASVEGTVTTLLGCTQLLYNTANGVDSGQYTQNEARAVIDELKRVLVGLQSEGLAAFDNLLGGAVKECTAMTSGIIYAKDIRYLQLSLSHGLYSLQEVFTK